jgi:hypothetical protein
MTHEAGLKPNQQYTTRDKCWDDDSTETLWK